jgi:hypothetical protein
VAQDTVQDVPCSAESLDLKQQRHTSLVTAVERKVMQCRRPAQYFRSRPTPLLDSLKQSHTPDISVFRNLPLSSGNFRLRLAGLFHGCAER